MIILFKKVFVFQLLRDPHHSWNPALRIDTFRRVNFKNDLLKKNKYSGFMKLEKML